MQPEEPRLPLTAQNNHIPAIFRPDLITNSYKFFWFLALLDATATTDQYEISIQHITRHMILRAWHPHIYFRLHFGKLDQLAQAIDLIRDIDHIPEDIPTARLLTHLQSPKLDYRIQKAIQDLGRYVPTRLLTPWFEAELSGLSDHHKTAKIKQLAHTYAHSRTQAPIYHFPDNQHIRLTWDWFAYLQDHRAILTDFTYWRLAAYLQRRNPNVPDIATKLIAQPDARDQTKLRKPWQDFLLRHPQTQCIYSNLPLYKFDIDHFLPWAYLTHDAAWNLLPAHPHANNQKRHQLPDPSLLLPFTQLQHHFLQYLHTHRTQSGYTHYLEDYAFFLSADPQHLAQLSTPDFQTALIDRFTPLLVQARHQGFPGPWQYTPIH